MVGGGSAEDNHRPRVTLSVDRSTVLQAGSSVKPLKRASGDESYARSAQVSGPHEQSWSFRGAQHLTDDSEAVDRKTADHKAADQLAKFVQSRLLHQATFQHFQPGPKPATAGFLTP